MSGLLHVCVQISWLGMHSGTCHGSLNKGFVRSTICTDFLECDTWGSCWFILDEWRMSEDEWEKSNDFSNKNT